MFPVLSQRVLIPLAAMVGGLAWLWALPAAMPVDGSEGISLFDGQAGPVLTLAVFLLAGMPAITLCILIGAMGNPLSGLFTLGVALLFPAIRGGHIDGWLWRIGAPADYTMLTIEAFVWTGALIGIVAICEGSRRALRHALPRLTTKDHFPPNDLGLRLPDGKAIIAGFVCAGIGGGLTTLLLTVSDTGQVVGTLIAAFTFAALLTQSILPQPNPLPLILAPALLALVAYAHVPFRYADIDALYTAWYTGSLWGPALALPVHYFAAGLVGVTLGLGISQAIDHARQEAAAGSPV